MRGRTRQVLEKRWRSVAKCRRHSRSVDEGREKRRSWIHRTQLLYAAFRPGVGDKPLVSDRDARHLRPYDKRMAGNPAISRVIAPRLGVRGLSATAGGVLVVVLCLAAYDTASAGIVALFGIGLLAGFIHPSLVAPYLALALPFGYWHPQFAGVQAPALEAAAAGAALGGLPWLMTTRKSQRRLDVADALFVALFLFIVLSGFGPAPRGEWGHNVVLWGALTLIFASSRRALRSRDARVLFLLGLGIVGCAEAIVTIVQYAEGAGDRFSRLGGAIVYPQPVGTLENPNSAAPFLVVCALALAGPALAGGRARRAVAAGVAILIGVASLLPYSRGGWISLAAGLLAWSGAQRRARHLVATIVVLGGLLFAAIALGGTFGSRLTSLASRHFSDLYGFRLTLAKRALHIIADHPLTGAGVFQEVGTYAGRPALATHPHDLLLGLAVFFGLPVALVFLGILALALRGALIGSFGVSAVTRAQAFGVFAALVAFSVDGLLEYQFWNQSWTVLTVLLFAYGIALGECEGKRDEPAGSSPTIGEPMSSRRAA
jgi:hypothetical protein